LLGEVLTWACEAMLGLTVWFSSLFAVTTTTCSVGGSSATSLEILKIAILLLLGITVVYPGKKDMVSKFSTLVAPVMFSKTPEKLISNPNLSL
jgi:hypothetical protein